MHRLTGPQLGEGLFDVGSAQRQHKQRRGPQLAQGIVDQADAQRIAPVQIVSAISTADC